MEQSELLAGAFEPLSLFEVSFYPCRVQNTLSRDTIKLGSCWSLPKPDIRLTEHVNNFGMSILIVHVFEKPTEVTVLLIEFKAATFGQLHIVTVQRLDSYWVSCILLCFSLEKLAQLLKYYAGHATGDGRALNTNKSQIHALKHTRMAEWQIQMVTSKLKMFHF